MVLFAPWRAIPAIVAESISIPWGIIKSMATMCHSIRKISRLKRRLIQRTVLEGKLNVNFMPIFLYEADTPSVYNKIRIMSFCIEAGG